jgi:hypothetical protein
VPMTFVTSEGIELESPVGGISRRGLGLAVLAYSGESASASNAFRLEIVTVRPSI